MAEIAAAAGVGRATLYRHYPTREALLEALAAEALEEAARRLGDAGLDRVPVEEALARFARALLAVGDRYSIVVRERVKPGDAALEQAVGEPARRLFARGAESGDLRDDIALDVQLALFGGALQAALDLVGERRIGIEDAAATVTSVFLDGARRR